MVALVVYGLVPAREGVPGPSAAELASQAGQILLDDVILVPRLEGDAQIARVPGEARIGVGPGGQQRPEIGWNERIGHRDGGEGAELGEAASARRSNRGIDVECVPIG